MPDEYIHKNDVQQIVIERNIEFAKTFDQTLSEIRSRIEGYELALAAITLRAGGQLCISERDMLAVRNPYLQYYYDQYHRKHVLTCKLPPTEKANG